MERQVNWESLDTFCPHVGRGEADGDPLVTPIVQSTTLDVEDRSPCPAIR